MSLEQKVRFFERSVKHDTEVINWIAYYKHRHNPYNKESLQFHKAALRWNQRLLEQYKSKLAPPLPAHYDAWLCIHRYEGSWNDAGSPYYGGLQMDIQFQASYGRSLLRTKGTADRWTPLEQMQVAEKAYSSGRGFYPWPNTARYCGLIN